MTVTILTIGAPEYKLSGTRNFIYFANNSDWFALKLISSHACLINERVLECLCVCHFSLCSYESVYIIMII